MADNSEFQFIYMTAPDRETALDIGRKLVEERLVACINVVDNMSALYWWQGEVQQDTEAIMIAKTRDDLVPKLIETVVELHPYDCPCVVALPIDAGFAGYLEWIRNETQPIPPHESPGPGS